MNEQFIKSFALSFCVLVVCITIAAVWSDTMDAVSISVTATQEDE